MKLLLTLVFSACFLHCLSQTPKDFCALYDDKKYDKAWELAWEMIKTDSMAAFGYSQIGKLYNDMGKYDSGIFYLRKAIALDSDRSFISGLGYANWGYALVMIGKRDSGIIELNKAVTVNKTENCLNCFCFSLHVLDSIGAELPGSLQIRAISKEGLLKDIDKYGAGIESNHVYPFSNISKKDFYAHLDQIKDTNRLNADEMLAGLMKVNAEIEDEHTNIHYSEQVKFPYYCRLFKEGVYIINVEESDRQILFSKIIAVNHIPISEVINRITTLLSDKNKRSIDEEAPKILSSPALLHGLHITDVRGSVSLTIVTKDNDTIPTYFDAKKYFDIKITGYHFSKPPLRYNNNRNYWYKYDSTGDFIYFRYSSCIEDSAYPFEKFQRDFFNEVKNDDPKKIIIDIRDNRGGHDDILRPFIDELSYSKYNKPRRIYVLMGRKTFSAAVNNLVYMMKTLTLTTIGEATSGSVNHYGGIKSFQLPNTGLEVTYSTKRITGVAYTNGPVKPKVVIPESISDFIYGTDPALNYAIADE